MPSPHESNSYSRTKPCIILATSKMQLNIMIDCFDSLLNSIRKQTHVHMYNLIAYNRHPCCCVPPTKNYTQTSRCFSLIVHLCSFLLGFVMKPRSPSRHSHICAHRQFLYTLFPKTCYYDNPPCEWSSSSLSGLWLPTPWKHLLSCITPVRVDHLTWSGKSLWRL